MGPINKSIQKKKRSDQLCLRKSDVITLSFQIYKVSNIENAYLTELFLEFNNLICVKSLLLSQTWVCLPTCSKANLLTLGCSEGKYSVHCRRQARRTGSSSSKDSGSLMTVREKVLKATFGGRVATCGSFSDWLVVKVTQ